MDITVCTCAALLYILGRLGAKDLSQALFPLAWYRIYSRQPCICPQILAVLVPLANICYGRGGLRICCRGLSCMFSLPGMPQDGPLLDAVVPSARRQVDSFSLAEAKLAVGSSVQLPGEERKKKRKESRGQGER